MSSSLERRLAALEHTLHPPAPDRSAEKAMAAEAFARKFDDLVQRLQGRDPGPGASPIEQIASQAWGDPAGALARLTGCAAQAQQALEQDPYYRRWRAGKG